MYMDPNHANSSRLLSEIQQLDLHWIIRRRVQLTDSFDTQLAESVSYARKQCEIKKRKREKDWSNTRLLYYKNPPYLSNATGCPTGSEQPLLSDVFPRAATTDEVSPW
jgi:hypothetical protein